MIVNHQTKRHTSMKVTHEINVPVGQNDEHQRRKIDWTLVTTVTPSRTSCPKPYQSDGHLEITITIRRQASIIYIAGKLEKLLLQ